MDVLGVRYFLHNVVAHPLLVLFPPLGEWLHDRTLPADDDLLPATGGPFTGDPPRIIGELGPEFAGSLCRGSYLRGGQFTIDGDNGITCPVCLHDFDDVLTTGIVPEHRGTGFLAD